MGSVFVENFPLGTKDEIEAAVKPFGKIKWYPLEVLGCYTSGFFELATPQHAAHFAEILGSLKLSKPIITKIAVEKSANVASVTALPPKVLAKRIQDAIERFGEKTATEIDSTVLDGTLIYEEIDSSQHKDIEEYILGFRKYAVEVHNNRTSTIKARINRTLASTQTSPTTEKKQSNQKVEEKFKQLESMYPQWSDKWKEFKEYAGTLAQQEIALSKSLSPANPTPEFYLKFKGVPPNTRKPQFIERRTAEIELENQVRNEIEAAKIKEKEQEQKKTKDVNPISDIVGDYFGELDADLVDFIKSLLPQGREALVQGLRDLLLEDTEAFVDKILDNVK